MNVRFFIVGDRGEVTYVWNTGKEIAHGFSAKAAVIYTE